MKNEKWWMQKMQELMAEMNEMNETLHRIEQKLEDQP